MFIVEHGRGRGGGGAGEQQASCLVAKQPVEFPQVLASNYKCLQSGLLECIRKRNAPNTGWR